MLNIAGAVALSALAIAGYLIITEPSMEHAMVADNSVSVYDAGENAELIAEASLAPEDPSSTMDDPKVSEKISSPVSKPSGKGIDEELLSFEASCEGGAILFNWTTMGNTKYAYEIEKTYDKVTYEVFSRAPQPEKKDGKNFYAVEEMTTADDDAFYRLRKVVGRDKFEYSDAVNVKCTKNKANKTEVDVFPNGYGSFRIVINTQADDSFKVSLLDINETELAAEVYEAIKGSNEFILSSSSITRGNYVLRVTNGNMVKEKKVVLK